MLARMIYAVVLFTLVIVYGAIVLDDVARTSRIKTSHPEGRTLSTSTGETLPLIPTSTRRASSTTTTTPVADGIALTPTTTPTFYVGSAVVTAYSPEETCPGGLIDFCVTAVGIRPVSGRTIACPRSIPFGMKVEINGKTYVCEDRTAKRLDGRFDIFMETRAEALLYGKKTLSVIVYER